MTGSTIRLFVDDIEVARRDDAAPVYLNDWPMVVGADIRPDGFRYETFYGVIYEVMWFLGTTPPPAAISGWLPGVTTLLGRQDAAGIVNLVRAQDTAGEWMTPSENQASQDFYGNRPLEIPRPHPNHAQYGADVLADRAWSSYELDVPEVRPLTLDELGRVLSVNGEPQAIRVRDDAHGPLVDLVANVYGGELAVEPEGWRARWVTSLPPGQLPTSLRARLLREAVRHSTNRPTPARED